MEDTRLDRIQEEPSTFKLDFHWLDPMVSVAKEPIMGSMGNATLKAELGRSAWRLLHTMMGKFPETPTTEESRALKNFIYLFARLYPCGDCARHFRKILQRNPPQVQSRKEASQWACNVHNLVNLRLNKTLFNCSTVQQVWKCGCAEDK